MLAFLLIASLAPSIASAAAPLISATSASQISTSSAMLKADVDPNGEATTYHFEYGSQGPCASNPCTSSPVPDVFAGSAPGLVPVSWTISDLQPGTTYHFRLVATNPSSPLGGTAGPDASFTTFSPSPRFDPCPNDELRSGAGARLPDCRAYEQATPVDKDGGDAGGYLFGSQASASGDAVTSYSRLGIPGGVGAQNYPLFVSRRVGAGWTTRGLLPPPSFGAFADVVAWTPDLDFAFDVSSKTAGNGSIALLLRDTISGSTQTIAPPAPFAWYYFAGASSDDSKLFIEARNARLTDEPVTGQDNLYVWDREAETFDLVGVLPAGQGGGAPAGGSFAGPFDWWDTDPVAPTRAQGGAERQFFTQDDHAIASDGDKVFFTAGGTAQIYLRRGLSGSSPDTVQVSASRRAFPDPNGTKAAIFMSATPSGSKAFFTSCEKLTDDSTAVSTAAEETCLTSSQGQDLYAFDTASGDLADLTIDGADPKGADVKGVIGASDDGSYVYFAANGDLDGPGPATLGDCQKVGARAAYTGTCSLYLWHDGVITFIASLATAGGETLSDATNWQPSSVLDIGRKGEATARVSASGATLLFRSQRQLTGYDNGGTPEYYRFQVGDPGLICVSCSPIGTAPTGPPTLSSVKTFTSAFGPTPFFLRHLSSDGDRFFFETTDKLAVADVNGDQGCPLTGLGRSCLDVYEWEADGSGSCDSAGGCIYLLSAGTSAQPSFFADASVSGDHVFIFTRDPLVPQDRDNGAQDIYDVSVGGGLASQHLVPPVPCEGEGCRSGSSVPPAHQGASSASFSGAPNAKPHRRHKKRHHRRNHHRRHSQSKAHSGREGAK